MNNTKHMQCMIDYCEDSFTCRRVYQLRYFGETFNKADCKGMCDNCKQDNQFEEKDMTN